MQAALTALLTALADGAGGSPGDEALRALAALVQGGGDPSGFDPACLAATAHTRAA